MATVVAVADHEKASSCYRVIIIPRSLLSSFFLLLLFFPPFFHLIERLLKLHRDDIRQPRYARNTMKT